MDQVAGELHAASLSRMRRAMKYFGMLPFSNHLIPKLLCNLWLIVSIVISTQFRFTFDYDFTYDFMNDTFSRTIDLSDFVGLSTAQFIIGMELIWWNHYKEIDSHLEEIRYKLKAHLGQNVNLQRLRGYCKPIYVSLLIRCFLFVSVTVWNSRALTYYALYSELVTLMRFSEFTLYCAVILAMYQELLLAGRNLLEELQQTQYEPWAVRHFTIKKLERMQQIHGLLWQAIRRVEHNFKLSLITILVKFFVDTSALPYWMYLGIVQNSDITIQFYCATDECIKLVEIMVPCWICTRCDVLQRRFRSLFYTVTTDRRNRQLNAALNRLCMQLGQEKCRFSAAGLVEISTEMLGKFIFGMVSYIVICIQFSMNLMASKLKKHAENFTTIEPK
ncbi:putative gustatory receptor 98a [Drosophila ananassae]|nr:putative gustatory receptor 98a [Drosophila ananassae]